MVTYRKARSDERAAYTEFAGMVFSHGDYKADFVTMIPKAYGEHVDRSDIHYLAVDDETGIRGLVAVMPNELKIGGETLKIGFIGTVSVHPEARGEGHMKKLMWMAIDAMKAEGVDLALLGGQRQRYEYFDFAKGGVGYSVTVGEPNVRHALKGVDASGISFELIGCDSRWIDAAHAMFESQSVRFSRPRESFVDCCNSYYARPWAILRDGSFVGYLVCSAEKDGISEILVDSMQTLDAAVKAWIAQNGLSRVRIMLPEWKTDMLKHLGVYAGDTSLEMRVQSSVYNPRRVLKAMLTEKARYTKLENASLSFDVEGDCFTVTVQDGYVEITDGGRNPVYLNRLEASQLFAYPFDYEGRAHTPQGWFPLPLFESSPDAF